MAKNKVSILTKIISGFKPSDFVIIDSDSSIWKTTLGLAIVRHAVLIQQKMPVAWFLLHGSALEMTGRLVLGDLFYWQTNCKF